MATGAAMDDAVEHGYKAVRFVSVTESIERNERGGWLVFVYSWEFTSHKSQEQYAEDGTQALADALAAQLGR